MPMKRLMDLAYWLALGVESKTSYQHERAHSSRLRLPGRVCRLIVFLLESLLSPECCWNQFLGLGVHVIRFDVQRDVLSDVY